MINKQEALESLYDEWAACERCPLHAPQGRTRRHVVFGEGNPDASLMIVGEAPGEEEDRTGHVFHGRSGTIVDGLLSSLNAKRDEVFFVNIVGCRPTEEDNPNRNRPPNPQEIKACYPRVQRIIEVVDPFVVLMLGEVAFKTLSSHKATFNQTVRNKFLDQVEVRTMGRNLEITRPGYVTYHPSYLLRNYSEAPDSDMHWAYRMWRRAFEVADMNANIYRGVPIPDRG